jgi:hypothetical protein
MLVSYPRRSGKTVLLMSGLPHTAEKCTFVFRNRHNDEILEKFPWRSSPFPGPRKKRSIVTR